MRWLFLLVVPVIACSRGRAHDSPVDTATVTAASRPDSAPSRIGWRLPDSVDRYLTVFDSIADRAQAVVQARAKTPAADSAFAHFSRYYYALEDTITQEIDNDRRAGDLAINSDLSDTLTGVLRRHGFDLNFSEGNAFADEGPGYLIRKFGPYVTNAMRDYLAIRTTEQQTRFSEDAGLRIPWDSIAERIVIWDAFLDRHSTFLWRYEATYWRDMYLETYLTGMDNSRTFTDSGTLDPDVRASYQTFLRRHPDTPSAEVVREYWSLLHASGFRSDSSVDGFLKKHKLHSMLGVQPPTN